MDGAYWVGRLEGGAEGVEEEEVVVKGNLGGGWLLVDWCPKRLGWVGKLKD